MVDVGDKPVSERRAVARAVVRMSAETLEAVRRGDAPKGDVVGTARLAGIQAAKRTAELIPLCHPLALSFVDVSISLAGEAVEIEAEARTSGQTGVEMEALTAASVAALTVYDMVKGLERGVEIAELGAAGEVGRPQRPLAAPVSSERLAPIHALYDAMSRRDLDALRRAPGRTRTSAGRPPATSRTRTSGAAPTTRSPGARSLRGVRRGRGGRRGGDRARRRARDRPGQPRRARRGERRADRSGARPTSGPSATGGFGRCGEFRDRRRSARGGAVKAAVVTVSSSLSRGEGEDVSGPRLVQLCEEAGLEVSHELVSDDREAIVGRAQAPGRQRAHALRLHHRRHRPHAGRRDARRPRATRSSARCRAATPRPSRVRLARAHARWASSPAASPASAAAP